MMAPAKRSDGFSLIEVLVALVVMAISLVTLFNVFSTGLRNTTMAEDHALATAHAQTTLARIGTEHPLTEGGTGGRIDEKFSWRVNVAPVSFGDQSDADEISVRPFRVGVAILWKDGATEKSVVLETLRLAHVSD
jgi:general secretion pathway protein I